MCNRDEPLRVPFGGPWEATAADMPGSLTEPAASIFIAFNTQEETQAFARLNADFESRRDLILAKCAARKGVGCGG